MTEEQRDLEKHLCPQCRLPLVMSEQLRAPDGQPLPPEIMLSLASFAIGAIVAADVFAGASAEFPSSEGGAGTETKAAIHMLFDSVDVCKQLMIAATRVREYVAESATEYRIRKAEEN